MWLGDTLEQNKIYGVFDIKTSAGGELTGPQHHRLKAVFGGNEPEVVRVTRKWTHSKGWHNNKKLLARLATMGVKITGLGSTVSALAFVSTANAESFFTREIDPLITQMNNADPELDRLNISIELSSKVTDYIGMASPASEVSDFAKLFAIYGLMAYADD